MPKFITKFTQDGERIDEGLTACSRVEADTPLDAFCTFIHRCNKWMPDTDMWPDIVLNGVTITQTEPNREWMFTWIDGVPGGGDATYEMRVFIRLVD